MKKRSLGDSSVELSVIGLGTWAIGGGEWDYGWGEQNERDSRETILAAFEGGINWIDTAPAYGLGVAEEVVGRAVKEWVSAGHKAPFIATKCGLTPINERAVSSILKRKNIFQQVEQSLKRLQVEQIDLCQIHWPDPVDQIEEGFQALLDLQQEGKIRFVGVSNFSLNHLQRISSLGKPISLQSPLSLVNNRIQDDIIPWCIKSKVGVLAYSPLQCGLLTGKVNKEWIDSLPENDWRKTKAKYFKEPQLSLILNFVEQLRKSEVGEQYSLTEIALAWVLAQEGITSAIVGARRKEQIIEVIKSINITFSEDDLIFIASLQKRIFQK